MTSLPGRVPLAPDLNSSLTSVGHWRNSNLPLPAGDGPGGARGDTGGGAGAWPASLQWVGSVNGTRADSCACGWDRG
jgi:hypothetical protein